MEESIRTLYGDGNDFLRVLGPLNVRPDATEQPGRNCHEFTRMRVQLVRLPRTRQQSADGRAVPAARRGRTRKLVPVTGTASRAGRAPPPHPPRRLPQPGQRTNSTRAAPDSITWQPRQPAADGRAVAGALAGEPGRAQKLHAARLCRARASVPGALPWADPAG